MMTSTSASPNGSIPETVCCISCGEEVTLLEKPVTLVRIDAQKTKEPEELAYCNECVGELDKLLSSWSALTGGVFDGSVSNATFGVSQGDSTCGSCGRELEGETVELIDVSRISRDGHDLAVFQLDRSCYKIFEEFLRISKEES